MVVLELTIKNFRGFKQIRLTPQGNVVLVGTPGAGRSDVLEALNRVLDSESSRRRNVSELDFNERDVSAPAEVEVVLGELGEDLQQQFLDRLELWDRTEKAIVPELEQPEDADAEHLQLVLRLSYRAELMQNELFDEWVYYPKTSDPDNRSFDFVRRADQEKLPYAFVRWTTGRPLDLSARSSFRRMVEAASGDDFADALAEYLEKVSDTASKFIGTNQVLQAMQSVLNLLRLPLHLGDRQVAELMSFVPEGGSTSGLLRSLGAAVDLGDGAGFLPTNRHGSSTGTLFRLAEAVALSGGSKGIVAIDDLGEMMDSASATHMASIIQNIGSQAWVATRMSSVVEIFEPEEVIRFTRDPHGRRVARQGRVPLTRVERLEVKFRSRVLIPVFAFPVVLILEGDSDLAALKALSERLFQHKGTPIPASHGIALVSADRSGVGGYSGVCKVADAARAMGFWSIGVLDGDTSPSVIEEAKGSADLIVRLPDNFAIERALIWGLEDSLLRDTIKEVGAATGATLPNGLDALSGGQLQQQTIRFLKTAGGLQQPWIDSLPSESLPKVAVELLDKIVEATNEKATGLLQLEAPHGS